METEGDALFPFAIRHSPTPAPLRPSDVPLHALERARLQFAVQHPRRIDRPRQDDAPGGRRRESHPAVIRLVADQDDQPGAAGARGFERARDERLAYAPAAKHRLDDQRAEQEGWRLPDPDRRHRVRADEQGADPGDETQRQIGGRRLAQAVGGARETARPEYALVEPKNGFRVVRRLRFDNQRQIGHGGSRVLATGALTRSRARPKARRNPRPHQSAERGCASKVSLRRPRVPRVASSGKASRAKNRASRISRSGARSPVTRKRLMT